MNTQQQSPAAAAPKPPPTPAPVTLGAQVKARKPGARAPYAAGWRWNGASFDGMTERERAAVLGRATEVRFMLAALERGFSVGRPYGMQPGWDCAVVHRGRFFRVQVKGTHWLRDKRPGQRADYALTTWPVGSRKNFDILALWIEEKGKWILLPASTLPPTGLCVRENNRHYAGLEDWGIFERDIVHHGDTAARSKAVESR